MANQHNESILESLYHGVGEFSGTIGHVTDGGNTLDTPQIGQTGLVRPEARPPQRTQAQNFSYHSEIFIMCYVHGILFIQNRTDTKTTMEIISNVAKSGAMAALSATTLTSSAP